MCTEPDTFGKEQREQFDCMYWPVGWEHLGSAWQTDMCGRSEDDTRIWGITVANTCKYHPTEQIITVEFVTFSDYSHMLA